MPDIPEPAVQAAAEVLFRDYESQYSAGHLTWREFADLARAVLVAAMPLIKTAGADKAQVAGTTTGRGTAGKDREVIVSGPGLHPFEPDWTLRPGEALAEILIDRQLGSARAGTLCGLGPEVIEGVVHGSVRIDEGIAGRLAKGLGPSMQFWLNYQKNYDEDIARGAKDVSDDPDDPECE